MAWAKLAISYNWNCVWYSGVLACPSTVTICYNATSLSTWCCMNVLIFQRLSKQVCHRQQKVNWRWKRESSRCVSATHVCFSTCRFSSQLQVLQRVYIRLQPCYDWVSVSKWESLPCEAARGLLVCQEERASRAQELVKSRTGIGIGQTLVLLFWDD